MFGRSNSNNDQPQQNFGSGGIVDKYGEVAKSARLLSQAIISTSNSKELRQRTDAGVREFWCWSFLSTLQQKLGSKSLGLLIESFDDYAIAGNLREGRGELIEALKALSGFTQIPPMGGVNLPAPTNFNVPTKNSNVNPILQGQGENE